MSALLIVLIAVVVLVIFLVLSVRILKQYERGVQFHLGKVKDGARGPGVILIIPFVDRIHRVSLRIVTMPIQSQGIITKDNVSVDVSAVAYFRVKDAVKSVVAIENVNEAINQIAQTTLRAVVGRHTLDETLSETEKINQNIREILDVQTEGWGIEVTVVEVKDIQLPDSMKRAMARQAEAEREKRAKIIAAEGEALAAGELAHASDVMMAHPLALQLRNLQIAGRAWSRQEHNRRIPRTADVNDPRTDIVSRARKRRQLRTSNTRPTDNKRRDSDCRCLSQLTENAPRGHRPATGPSPTRALTRRRSPMPDQTFHAGKPVLTVHPVGGGEALAFPITPSPPLAWWIELRSHAHANPILVRPWDEQRADRFVVMCPALHGLDQVIDAVDRAVAKANDDSEHERQLGEEAATASRVARAERDREHRAMQLAIDRRYDRHDATVDGRPLEHPVDATR